MLYWLGLFVAGKMRSRAKAIIAALIVLVLLCAVVPCLLAAAAIMTDVRVDRAPFSLLFLGSPAMMIVALEFRDVARQMGGKGAGILLLLVLNCAFYGVIWFILRAWCLRRADAILGRTGRNG
jgi:uncharacterized membrane protein